MSIAIDELVQGKSEVDSEIVHACLDAATTVFKVTIGSDIVHVRESRAGRVVNTPGFCASIALFGDWTGHLQLRLPCQLAADLIGKIIGCDPNELDEASLQDGMGEIINQISGRVQTELSRKGRTVRIGIPDVASLSGWRRSEPFEGIALRLDCRTQRFELSLLSA